MLTAIALATAAAMCERTIDHDSGGIVNHYAAMIAQENCLVRIPDGVVCESACAMWLGARHVCVEPGAVFVFHPPGRLGGGKLPPVVFWDAVDTITSHYPPALAKWYRAVAVRGGFHTIRGAELIRIGVQECDP